MKRGRGRRKEERLAEFIFIANNKKTKANKRKKYIINLITIIIRYVVPQEDNYKSRKAIKKNNN